MAGAEAEIAHIDANPAKSKDKARAQAFRRKALVGHIEKLDAIPLRGQHHFRFPGFAVAVALREWFYLKTDPGNSLFIGALVGAFWANRTFELEATFPRRGSSQELDEYADAVLSELQDQGYDWQEIVQLQRACDARCGEWLIGTLTEARDAADFSKPEEEAA